MYMFVYMQYVCVCVCVCVCPDLLILATIVNTKGSDIHYLISVRASVCVCVCVCEWDMVRNLTVSIFILLSADSKCRKAESQGVSITCVCLGVCLLDSVVCVRDCVCLCVCVSILSCAPDPA